MKLDPLYFSPMYNSLFPFHNLTNFELSSLLERPNHRIEKILNENNFGKYIHDALESGMDKDFKCNYFTEESLGELLKKISPSLSVINLNIRSLDKHFSDLLTLLYNLDFPIDIVTLTEIGKKNVSNRINMLSDKYYCEHIPPKTKKCGGACIFISKNIKYCMRNDLSILSDDVEDVWLEAKVNDQKVIIGSIYRHPGTRLDVFQNHLELTLQKIDNEHCQSYICGDFNADGLKLDVNRQTTDFYNCLMTYNFIPAITLPTRITETSMTLIDNIFIKINKENITDKIWAGNIYSDISDHLPNFIAVQNHRSIPTNSPRKKVRLFGDRNIEKFANGLSAIDWSGFFNSDNVNSIVDMFYDKFNMQFENSFPLKTLSRKRAKDKVWLTTGLKISIRKKGELYHKYLNHPTLENKLAYTSYRNILTSSLRKAEAVYYIEKVNDKKKNVRALWQIYGPIINPNKVRQSRTIEQIRHKNTMLTDKKEIANVLNDYFINIGPQLSKQTTDINNYQQYMNNNQSNSLYLYPTEPSEILNLISKLDNNKSPGDDAISSKLLKTCPIIFSKLISHIANVAMTTGIYPQRLKIGKVIPIHKKGTKIDPTNYRPISLLSIINKLLEKVLHKRLYTYFEKNEIIYPYQFGFRHTYSTTMALIEITDQLRMQMENKDITIGIYIDLSKAFDLVNHSILTSKLQSYGIRGIAIELIRSYLSNRSQYTKIEHAKSDIKNIMCGVPQGSVLGPLFFLIFVNDMQNCTSAQLRLFADDTNIFISHKDPQIIKQKAEQCLNDIIKWLTANRLLLSEEKTNYSIFMPRNKDIPDTLNSININGKTILRTDSCKYLGLILDDKLTFKNHIDLLCKDLIKVISAFRIIKEWVPNKHKLKLYYAYFHSKLLYALEIYGTSANKYIRRIEVLQHRAIKVLFSLDYFTPSTYLYSKYKILPIRDLYSLKVAKFMYNQFNNKNNNVFSDYFETIAHVDYPNTRNRFKLRIPRTKTAMGTKMIKTSGAQIWNTLTDALKQDLRCLSYYKFNKLTKEYYLQKHQCVP